MRDFYKVLGLDPTATHKEIKKAYKKLAGQYHPDKWAGEDAEDVAQAEVEFKLVEEAYRVLKDPINRAHFDSTGSGDMPKSKQIAVKKIIHLFQRHIKDALEKELAIEVMTTRFGAGMVDVTSGMERILETVRHALKSEKQETTKSVKNLEKGVKALNKYKRAVKSKGTSNLYFDVIEQQLIATQAALAMGGIELIAIQTALEHLNDYEYEDVAEQPLYGTHFIGGSVRAGDVV